MQKFDFDVISQPAMPPPPPPPKEAAAPAGMANSADPRHKASRGEPQ
jgi:hypothetical protein